MPTAEGGENDQQGNGQPHLAYPFRTLLKRRFARCRMDYRRLGGLRYNTTTTRTAEMESTVSTYQDLLRAPMIGAGSKHYWNSFKSTRNRRMMSDFDRSDEP